MMPWIKIDEESALIVVDVQNDFTPGGALPVRNGDKVIDPLNRYIDLFLKKGRPIIFTRDWHPPDHISFTTRGGPWPPHCVQNSKGAEFHPDLYVPREAIILSKGNDPAKEAYSGFQGTDLERILKSMKISKLFVGGLATDYCVKSTILDAIKLQFKTYLLSDGSMGVDINPGDSEKAVREMVKEGAFTIRFEDLAD